MKLIVALMSLLLSLSVADAAEFYSHNGSLMRVDLTQGRGVAIYYERPRESLARIGIRPGQVLFEGRTNGAGYLEGMSRLFSSRCGEIDYFVYGDFTPGRPFRLDGVMPVRDRSTCAIIDNVHTADTPSGSLVFTPASAPEPSRQAQTRAPSSGLACVTRVRAGSTLNMRAGPSTAYGVVAEIPANDCDVEIGPTCRGDWCGVRHQGPQGSVGWVNTNYLRPR